MKLDNEIDKHFHEIMCQLCNEVHLYIGDFSEEELNSFPYDCYFIKGDIGEC